jgi:hypothetical protein
MNAPAGQAQSVQALTRALRSSTDGKLAHQILVDIGVARNQTTADSVPQTDAYDEEREVQTIGKVLPGREFKLAADGEILVHGENFASGEGSTRVCATRNTSGRRRLYSFAAAASLCQERSGSQLD